MLSCTLNQFKRNGIYKGIYAQTPDGVVWPESNVLPAIVPLMKMSPIETSATPDVTWYKNSLEGVPWEYPVRVAGGSGIRFWVLRQGAPGMTIDNGAFDESGKWSYGEAGNLKWGNPVVGSYTIIVDVFDQTDQVTFIWTHTCDEAGDTTKHIIGAPTSQGTGDGSSPANAMGLAQFYLGDTTISPTRNKCLHLLGGDYSLAPKFNMNPAYHSTNIGAYADQVPRFSCQFEDKGEDRFLGKIEFHDFVVTGGGLIQTIGFYERLVDYKIRCMRIAKSGGANNQSCRYTNGINGFFRKHLVSTQFYLEDCQLQAFETYSIGSHLYERDNYKIVNPAITTLPGGTPIWFPKAGIQFTEISNCTFDNININAGTEGVLYPYNAGTFFGSNPDDQVCTIVCDYNIVRCAGGTNTMSNRASNGASYPVTANVYIRRCTLEGGGVGSENFEPEISARTTYFIANAIQNPNGGVAPDAVNAIISQDECSGVSGVLDANGNLTGAFLSYLYTRGAEKGIAA